MFGCNLPPALFTEFPGSFTCCYDNGTDITDFKCYRYYYKYIPFYFVALRFDFFIYSHTYNYEGGNDNIHNETTDIKTLPFTKIDNGH